MVKAIGIDSGTKSMDIFGFDDKDDRIFIDRSIPRDDITENPKIVMDLLEELNADVVVGPSGYGLPLKRARDTDTQDINLATFITKADYERRLKIVGLRELMLMMRESEMNIFFTPGVIHLPTVPEYRKANKIDMGTSDKVFSAVLGIKDQAEHYDITCTQTSFIILEIGFGYTSAMGINNGKIVDGIGGTSGGLGYMSMGAMDSELVYALANTLVDFPKMLLFKGGAAYLSCLDPLAISPEEFIKSEKSETAYKAFIESAIKDISILLTSVRKPKDILLSGRFTRIEPFISDLKSGIGEFLDDIGVDAEIRTLRKEAENSKEAAEGAAIMANGIAGGRYSQLLDNMEIKKSSGDIFDYIYLDNAIMEKIREEFTN